jgi:hypothetical protein
VTTPDPVSHVIEVEQCLEGSSAANAATGCSFADDDVEKMPGWWKELSAMARS